MLLIVVEVAGTVCDADCSIVTWWQVMAACRQVYDSHHLQADCQEPRSAPEPYAR